MPKGYNVAARSGRRSNRGREVEGESPKAKERMRLMGRLGMDVGKGKRPQRWRRGWESPCQAPDRARVSDPQLHCPREPPRPLQGGHLGASSQSLYSVQPLQETSERALRPTHPTLDANQPDPTVDGMGWDWDAQPTCQLWLDPAPASKGPSPAASQPALGRGQPDAGG